MTLPGSLVEVVREEAEGGERHALRAAMDFFDEPPATQAPAPAPELGTYTDRQSGRQADRQRCRETEGEGGREEEGGDAYGCLTRMPGLMGMITTTVMEGHAEADRETHSKRDTQRDAGPGEARSCLCCGGRVM